MNKLKVKKNALRLTLAIALSLGGFAHSIEPQSASNAIAPDAVQVIYREVPAILSAETSSEIYAAGQGVTTTLNIENPLPDLVMDFDIQAVNGAIVRPVGVLSTAFRTARLIPASQKAQFEIFFSDINQSVQIKSSPVSSRAIAATLTLWAIDEIDIDIVDNIATLKADRITKIAIAIETVGDYGKLAKTVNDLINLLKGSSLANFATQLPDIVSGFRDFIKEEGGRSFFKPILDSIGLDYDALEVATTWLTVLKWIKRVANGIAIVVIRFWNKTSFETNIDVLPKTFGEGMPPVAPRLITPLNNNTSNKPHFEWGRVPRAESYFFELDEDPSFGSPIVSQWLSQTNWDLPQSLEQTHSYYWRVRAKTAFGNEGQTAVGSFVVGSLPQTQDPLPSVNNSQFISDVTIPSQSSVVNSQNLVKIWRLRNTGTTAWDSSVKLAFRRGKQMGAPNEVSVPNTLAGALADVSVNLTAPSEAGEHVGYWQLKRGSTFFGPELKVQINVRAGAPPPKSSTEITVFDLSPASPSTASSVRLVGRVKQFADFRSMRFVVGTDKFEQPNFKAVGDQYEISIDWNTASLARGTYAVALEVARVGDNNWSSPIRQIKSYTLNGSPTASNHPPSRPVLQSPYNWFLRDAAGSATSVPLCVSSVSDPEGDAVQYYFEVTGATNYNSGWVNSNCWTGTFNPANYSWQAKARDNKGAESGWSAETWNFSVASGGVTVGDLTFYQTGTNDTHFCVPVTYGGIIAPEVTAFINLAADGSESGVWKQLDHYGPNAAPDCTTSNVHGFWVRSPDYDTGTHAIKVNAVKRDSGASATRSSSYNIPFMAPPGPQAIAPSSVNNNGTWWNTYSINFQWSSALRASGYTLRVSRTPDPLNDPLPVINQNFGSSTTSATIAIPAAHNGAQLYWSVRASNGQGNADSAVAWFGVDVNLKPTCVINSLQSVFYDNVIPVQWGGNDAASGVRSYDVQVRDTLRGDWLDWLVDSGITLGQFIGQPGHSYEFRCRARDWAGNIGDFPSSAQTSTRVDPTARPPEPWWNSNYSGKRDISIQNNMTGVTLPAGYPVVYRISGTTAAEIYNASQSNFKCNDLRVIYNNTTELDRLVTQCSSSNIEIWFRNQIAISPSESRAVHQLYFGNPSAGAPPSAVSAVWQPTVDGNTVAMYYFQEGNGSSTFDSSGNNRTCSINASVAWAASKFGQGLQFNRANAGNSRSLMCGPTPALTAFTIDFWYNPDSDGDGSIAGALAGGGNGGGGNNWVLSNFEGRIRLDVWPCGSCGSSDVQSDFNLRDAAYLGKWHHIAVTFNGGNEVKFYLDGSLNSTKILGQSGINTYAPPLEIGSAEGIRQLKGNLGAFRLSNIVRTDFGYGGFAGITREPNVAFGAMIRPSIVGSVDLAVLGMNAYPYANGAMLIEAIVQNQGSLPTGNNTYTDLYLNHAPTGKGDLIGSTHFWINDSILPGQIVTLTTIINSLPTTAINRVAGSSNNTSNLSAATETTAILYLQTDSSNAINEVNTNNNRLSQGTEICVTNNDNYEGDNSLASAKALFVGEAQRHNFGSPSDEDWIYITAQSGKEYQFETSSLDYAADTIIELYQADGTLITSNDDANGGLGSKLSYTATSNLNLYLRIRHWNANTSGCGTSYSVRVTNLDTTPPQVSWTSPVGNEQTLTVSSGVVSLQVNATGNYGITRVVFERWDVVNQRTVSIFEDTTLPYVTSINVADLNMAWNQINAIAIDNAGNATTQYIWIYRGQTDAVITTPPPVVVTASPSITTTPTPSSLTRITYLTFLIR